MAVNTSESLNSEGYSLRELPYGGQAKVPMWKLESPEEALDENGNPRERHWIRCGPFKVEMIRKLRARGFTEVPPERPSTGDISENKAKCELCPFEAKSEFGLRSHMRKHKAEREFK